MRNRSTRLDITDMPRDKERALGTLRQTLAASFNYCRRYPNKMAVLGKVLEYTLSRVKDWQEEYGEGEVLPLGRPKSLVPKPVLNKKYKTPKAPQEVSNVASNSGNKQSPEPKKIVQGKAAEASDANTSDASVLNAGSVDAIKPDPTNVPTTEPTTATNKETK